MKYIRTKDGRISSFDDYCDIDYIYQCINGIKVANTIEELCDEFVYYKGNFKIVYQPSTYSIRDLNFYDEIYGAIWTSKGLIYVAKMNDKGELELL